ncbi:MAG: HAD-IA family hydrolase [Dehalococcoidia bacterium]|nr:HAD-IA family hydrolase [Dehalococcoidia bacterium]
MIKAVFFDFYKTLVCFWPPLDEIQQASCAELGLRVSKEGIRKGYKVADEYMAEENAKAALADRTDGQRDEFFAEYERRILEGAGLDVSLRLAWDVWQMAIQVPKDFDLFDDVLPALKQLKTQGVVLAIISNLRRDMTALCTRLGLDPYMDFCVTSAEAGAEKPHPPIFKAALDRAHVAPAEAIHVGDQYEADVQGARAVGIQPVLLDREGWYGRVNDCSRIASLPELEGLVTAGSR